MSPVPWCSPACSIPTDHREFDLCPPLGHGAYRELPRAAQTTTGATRRRSGASGVYRARCAYVGGAKEPARRRHRSRQPRRCRRRATWPLRACPGRGSMRWRSSADGGAVRGGLAAAALRGPRGGGPVAAHGAGRRCLRALEYLRTRSVRRARCRDDAGAATPFRAVVWCPLSNEFLYGVPADIGTT